MENTIIYGKHAVTEAVKQRPDIIKSLYVKQKYLSDPSLVKHLKKLPVTVIEDDKDLPREFDRHAVHQGMVAVVDVSKLLVPFKEFTKNLEVNEKTGLILLGEVSDPHNVGAIIRSAAAFGFSGVLIPKNRQAPVTGTVIKVSAGTAFRIPLVEVGNVNTSLRQLKKDGFWVYGLDMEGDSTVFEDDFSKPSVLVVGNEGSGIRAKTNEICDSILNIPINTAAESLNASVSAAVAMAFWRSRKF